jgi:hypothetical protein
MNRRRALVVFAVSASLLGIAVSCTFPELPSFTPDGDGAAPDASSEAASGDGGAKEDAFHTDVDPEGGSQEASVLPTGGGTVDAAGCTSCDCDGDGFDRVACDGGVGKDCDDLNTVIKPDAGFVASPSWPSMHMPSGDWNCDGMRTKQHNYNVHCDDTSNGGANCTSGFNDDPNCGEISTFNICKYNPGVAGLVLPSCKIDSTVQLPQGCK